MLIRYSRLIDGRVVKGMMHYTPRGPHERGSAEQIEHRAAKTIASGRCVGCGGKCIGRCKRS
jgi:hypothetical protein